MWLLRECLARGGIVGLGGVLVGQVRVRARPPGRGRVARRSTRILFVCDMKAVRLCGCVVWKRYHVIRYLEEFRKH